MPPRLLVLACGTLLRGDDGVGWRIAEALVQTPFAAEIEVLTSQQLTPELAESVSRAEAVVFVDASGEEPPGSISLKPVAPAPSVPGSLTHHLDPATLLATAQILYGRTPRRAHVLTVGAGSFDLGEELSEPVCRAIPDAVRMIETLLATSTRH
ncbi:MAG: hydrogenase maturation protease [Candidatus Acidiferrales bacterium]|jgi:hydrogenase maturation protease